MATANESHDWPGLAVGLYDKLTGRNAEIAYNFNNFELLIPSATGEDVKHASWRMNGSSSSSRRDCCSGRL